MIDLDAYFACVGYAGTRDASMATLRALHRLHPLAIPFENLDPLLGRVVSLDLDDVQAKLVQRKRGGYCFEHNVLFRAVLEALGFRVSGLAARVVWMAPPDRAPGPRTHMLLRVDCEGQDLIADVGFGGLLQDGPLRLVADIEQSTPSESARYVRAGDTWRLEARVQDRWHGAYEFMLDPQVDADYMIGNWYTSAHPNSLFRNHLMMERLEPSARLSLSNRKLTRRFRNGRTEQRLLRDRREFWDVLTDDFGLDPPDEARGLFDKLPG